MPLERIQSLDTSKLTGAELVVLATLKAAWKGKTLAAVEATDRSEGKVPIAATVQTTVGLASAFRDAAVALAAHHHPRGLVEDPAQDATTQRALELPEPDEF